MYNLVQTTSTLHIYQCMLKEQARHMDQVQYRGLMCKKLQRLGAGWQHVCTSCVKHPQQLIDHVPHVYVCKTLGTMKQALHTAAGLHFFTCCLEMLPKVPCHTTIA